MSEQIDPIDYESLVTQHGDSPLSLGWGLKDRREIRFKYLLKPWTLNNTSIMDIGCGFGDLYGYLTKNNLPNSYTGIDRVEKILEIAREKYPEGHFLLKDFLNEKLPKADYYFGSGILNDVCEEPEVRLNKVLKIFLDNSKLGFSLNFLSKSAKIKYKHANYTDAGEVASIIGKFGNRYMIDHSYMPFEFTLHYSKSHSFDLNLITFDQDM